MFKKGDKITLATLGGASGANYKNAELTVENNLAMVSPSIKSYRLEFFFQFLIWGTYIVMTRVALQNENEDPIQFIVFISIFSLSFSLIIRFIFSHIRKFHFFDKKSGVYYLGKVRRDASSIDLSDIKVLYLISKRVYTTNRSYKSFELSFCTSNEERVVIMNHGDRDWIKTDADKLSNFLGVPCETLKNGSIYE